MVSRGHALDDLRASSLSHEKNGIGRRSHRLSATERPQNCIEHQVQFPAHVFSKKTQNQVAVLLQQLILAAITTVCDGIREMLAAVQLHSHAGIGTQKVDFECSETVQCDRQRSVDAETALGLR